jgi:hypothetical protein
MGHPFDLANIAMPALDGIIRALSDHDTQPAGRRRARDSDTLNVILSFQPRDVIDVTLSGQTVLFSAVLADTAREVLHVMPDARKPRGISSLIGMGRLVQGHLDRLRTRGCEPYRTEAATMPQSTVAAMAAPMPENVGGAPWQETSWLDAPFEQWVVETRADPCATDLSEAAERPAAATTPAVADVAAQGRGETIERPGCSTTEGAHAFPRQPTGYPGTRTWVGATAKAEA